MGETESYSRTEITFTSARQKFEEEQKKRKRRQEDEDGVDRKLNRMNR